MPREYIHWTVLEQTLSEVRSEAMGDRSLLAAAYVGAILPDVPDFYRGGFCGGRGERISAFLHGVYGDDPLEFVRQLVSNLPSKDNPDYQILVGLILGYASHIVVDATFHPLVVYLCGDWYQKDEQGKQNSRARHRLLETELDIWAMQSFKFSFKQGLRAAVQYLKRDQIDLILTQTHRAYAGLALPPQVSEETLTKNFIKSSLTHTIWLQETFRSNLSGKAIALLLKKLNRAELATLFHQGKDPEPQLFYREWDYQRVVSGEPCRDSFSSLLEQSITTTRGWFEQILAEIYDNKRSVLLSARGPSLDCGEIGAVPSQYRYFAKKVPDWLEVEA